MPDPIVPELPAALTDAPQADAMSPPEGSEAVKTMTHDVKTDE